MKKSIYTIAAILLITLMTFSPAAAGGVSGKISLGSIVFDGAAFGFGKYEGIKVTLNAGSHRFIADCINTDDGSTETVTVNIDLPVSVSISDQTDKNGKFTIDHLEADPNGLYGTDVARPDPQQVCDNDDYDEHGNYHPDDDDDENWTYTIAFAYWDSVTVTVRDLGTNAIVFTKSSACTTTHDPDTIVCPGFNK